MNIFFFHQDINLNASYYPDCYYKIVLEIAQMCSTAKRINDGYAGYLCYKASYVKHPMTIWVGQSIDHFMRAAYIGLAIEKEMIGRGFKPHKSARVIEWLIDNPPQFEENIARTPPLCMPEQYKSAELYESYRRYFKFEKYGKIKCKWTSRLIPHWLLT